MLRLTFAFLAGLVLSSPAAAAIITVSGSFAATDSTPPGPGIPTSISATWSSQPFDTVVVPADFGMFTVGLASLSFSPSPYQGAFAFDTTNTALLLFFNSGALSGVQIGGVLSEISVVVSDTNDFVVSYHTGVATIAFWTSSGTPGVNEHDPGSLPSGQVTVATPEPAALPLLALGLFAVTLRKSLRR